MSCSSAPEPSASGTNSGSSAPEPSDKSLSSLSKPSDYEASDRGENGEAAVKMTGERVMEGDIGGCDSGVGDGADSGVSGGIYVGLGGGCDSGLGGDGGGETASHDGENVQMTPKFTESSRPSFDGRLEIKNLGENRGIERGKEQKKESATAPSSFIEFCQLL